MHNPFTELETRLDKIQAIVMQALEAKGSNTPGDEIINRDELCRRLQITEPTAIRWERKGRIPSFNIGSAVRYNWPRVVEALEAQKKGGAV